MRKQPMYKSDEAIDTARIQTEGGEDTFVARVPTCWSQPTSRQDAGF